MPKKALNFVSEAHRQLAERIAAELRVRNWTQKDLADKADLEPSKISEILHGRYKRWPHDRIEKIRVAFGIELGDLVGNQGPGTREPEQLADTLREFDNASHMRSSPIVWSLLREDGRKLVASFFPDIRSGMWDLPLGKDGVILPIPVSVLSRGGELKLSDSPSQKEATLDGVDGDDYVRLLRRRVAAIEQKGGTAQLTNDIVYTLLNLKVEGAQTFIDGGFTRYLPIQAVHDSLEHELLGAAYDSFGPHHGRTNAGDTGKLRAALHKRDRLLKKEPLAERLKYMGISASAVYIYKSAKDERNDGYPGYRVLVWKRASGLAAHANLLHVLPSFMFQHELNFVQEWNVETCIQREYCEELYNRRFDEKDKDLHAGSGDLFDILMRFPEWVALKSTLDDKICEIFYSGLVLNLMNLRPEICNVLLCHDGKWFDEWRGGNDKHEGWKINWEFAHHREIVSNTGRAWTAYHLDKIEEQFLDELAGLPGGAMELAGRWVPVGLASLWLGVAEARRRLGLGSSGRAAPGDGN